MIDEITMRTNMDPLIASALREDISSEDVSTNSVVKSSSRASAQLLRKGDGIIAGLDVFLTTALLLMHSFPTAMRSLQDSISLLSKAVHARYCPVNAQRSIFFRE